MPLREQSRDEEIDVRLAGTSSHAGHERHAG
jgi:hypothetical protein